MTHYKRINVKLSNSQLKKLKSAKSNVKDVPRRSSSSMIGTNETNFQHRLFSTNRHISPICKGFPLDLLANIELSKIRLSEITQSVGFLGKILRPLMKADLPLMKNELHHWLKVFLYPLRLTAAASAAADSDIQKKGFGSITTSSVVSNEEIEDIMKVVKSLKGTGLSTEGVTQVI